MNFIATVWDDQRETWRMRNKLASSQKDTTKWTNDSYLARVLPPSLVYLTKGTFPNKLNHMVIFIPHNVESETEPLNSIRRESKVWKSDNFRNIHQLTQRIHLKEVQRHILHGSRHNHPWTMTAQGKLWHESAHTDAPAQMHYQSSRWSNAHRSESGTPANAGEKDLPLQGNRLGSEEEVELSVRFCGIGGGMERWRWRWRWLSGQIVALLKN